MAVPKFFAKVTIIAYKTGHILYTIVTQIGDKAARWHRGGVAARSGIRQYRLMKPTSPPPSSTDRAVSAEALAQDLSAAIHAHRIAPGMKLGEDDLSDVYGVSRTIVRSALQTLAHQKLVDIKRNRGAFVASPSPRDASEVFEARIMIEPHMAEVAALKATPQDIAVLRQHIADEHAAVVAGDRGQALALSGRFHLEIARMADQATIADFVRSLVERSSLIIALYWRKQSTLCESGAHHALLDALAVHDGPATHELMKHHLLDLQGGLDLHKQASENLSLKDALRR
jgi:DNA-binding GntR family transcriptional regulator